MPYALAHQTTHPQWFRILAMVLFVIAFATRGSTQAQLLAPPQSGDLLVLSNVTVVDVRTGTLHADQTITIDGNRITGVIDAKAAKKSPRYATHINCKGLFVIPGLWDMHVHLVFGDWFPGARDISLSMFIAKGITGVRDMGSELDVVHNWRNEIEAGRLLGPRIYSSGPMLDGPKPRFPSSIAISTPEDGRRAVADLKRRGADFIKLQSLIPREAVLAIADEAKKEQINFEGHVPDSVRASEMSEAGMKSFEHLIGIFEGSSPAEDDFLKGGKTEARFLSTYDPARANALATQLAKNQTWQCPTLVWERGGNLMDVTDFGKDPRAKYAPTSWKTGAWKRFTDEIVQGYGGDNLEIRKQFIQHELETVELLHEKGVPFLAGTDTPAGVYVFPGFSLHEELQRLVEAKFTPLEALQAATLNPARFFGIEDHSGTVETGRRADLVLLNANPLADIANTQQIAAVIVNGRYLSSKELQKLLDGVEAAARD